MFHVLSVFFPTIFIKINSGGLSPPYLELDCRKEILSYVSWHEENIIKSHQAWTISGSDLYTCSEDGQIGHCRVNARKSKPTFEKFRPEAKKSKLFSLALHPSEASALVGSTSKILWVDLDTKSTLRAFQGHQGNVISLEVIHNTVSAPLLASAGSGERDQVISVWSLDPEAAKTTLPEVTLNANEGVRSLCGLSASKERDAVIGCVTASGNFQCFEYDPAGKRKKGKSVKPRFTVQVREMVSVLWPSLLTIIVQKSYFRT